MSPLAVLTERLISWLAWLVAVLWITDLLPLVAQEMAQIHFNFGKTRIDLRSLVEGLLSSGLVLVLALWLSATIEQRVLAQTMTDLSMRKIASNVLRAVLLLIGLLLALSAVGVDLTALSVLGGALGGLAWLRPDLLGGASLDALLAGGSAGILAWFTIAQFVGIAGIAIASGFWERVAAAIVFPYAWVFFILFILIATFVIFNLFIAVIVDSITADHDKDHRDHHHQNTVQEELQHLRREMAELRQLLVKQNQ
jgi:hypothetical protein